MVCAVAALAAGGVLAATSVASAQTFPACNTLGNKNPVYVAGSSASKPIWAALGGKIPGIDIIYQGPSSCQGLSDVTGATADASTPFFFDGTTPGGVQCSAPGPVMIGVSDVFATSCPGFSLPSGFQDFTGPIQAMVMAVSSQSTESSISWDAAYTVFGWGGTQYPVAPWTNYTDIFIRTPSSGTETMIGSAIGLAPSKWLSQAPDGGASQQFGKSGDLVKALEGAVQQNSSNSAIIAIIASDIGDTYRGTLVTNDAGTTTGGLKVLAFQAKNQSCGYLPDSDQQHYEKINVRQGRYDIWGPLHMVTAVNGSTPANTSVATVLKYLQLDTSLATTDAQTVIKADAGAHVIPQCAMQVSRSAEVTPDNPGMASYQPPMGCGCYYESLVNGGQAYSKYCKTCTAATDCTNSSYPKCNFGFCEAQ
jgi:hypothetical protein